MLMVKKGKKNIEKKGDSQVNTKGIKIQTLARIVAVVSVLLFFACLYNLYGFINKYRVLVDSVDVYVQSQDYLSDLQDASDYMTDQSRMYVLTQEPKRVTNYFNVVNNKERENALDNLNNILNKSLYIDSFKKVEDALEKSNSLMDYEIHSMKLIYEITDNSSQDIPEIVKNYQLTEEEKQLDDYQKLEKAYNLVYGKKYRSDKAEIDNNIESATTQLSNELKDNAVGSVDNMWIGINEMVLKIFIMMVILVAVSILIAILVVRPLRIYVRCINEERTIDVVGAYEFKYLAITYNNIFELNKEIKSHMKFKLEHDALTHVYSRAAFEEHKELLLNEKMPLALLIFDIDYFKSINDTYGHEKGDEILVKVAKTISDTFNPDDIVARVGGDEFAAIIKNIKIDDIESLENKLVKLNEILQNPKEGEIKTSLSIGAAFSEAGYSNALYKQADEALYRTKKNGRCGYSVY